MTHLSSSLSTGQLVGPCRVVRLLGRGGMGEVYLAEHLSLQKPVALKILPPDLESRSKNRVERFLKEARTASRIEHSNVVVIHDVGEQDGVYYIVMQYVQGKNLSELVDDHGGPLPWRSAARLVQLAAKGLHAVHSCGLVHRDIKPSNIMLSVESRVVLMDFGLVREEVESGLTRPGQVVGTPSFMSPEQCRGGILDRRSDICSLGSTLYYLLTARAPYRGTLQEVVVQIAGGARPEPIRRINQGAPSELCEVVAKAMAPRPGDRYQTALAMARVLKRLLRSGQLDSTTTGRTAEVSAPAIETQPVPAAQPQVEPPQVERPQVERPQVERPQVELLPLETRQEAWQAQLPWIGAIVGVLAGLLLIGLLLRSIYSVSDTTPEAPAHHGSSSRGSLPPPPPGMVRIEAGTAVLGNDETKLRAFLAEFCPANELDEAVEMLSDVAPRRVEVPSFSIDQYEVTNAEYARFVEQTGRSPPDHWNGTDPPSGQEGHPVVNVSYGDAEAYATWAGKRLPTREQWMRAYRGDREWLFPWGDDYDAGRANVKDNPEYPSTCPVRDTPRDVSPFGIYNLVGNASEFVRGTEFRKGRTWRLGKGAEFGTYGFLFGIAPGEAFYRPLEHKDRGLGFRCVVEDPPPSTSP